MARKRAGYHSSITKFLGFAITPEKLIASMSSDQLRNEYYGLLRTAERRLANLQKDPTLAAGYGSLTHNGKGWKKLGELKSDRAVAEELTYIGEFLMTPESTVRGAKAKRAENIKYWNLRLNPGFEPGEVGFTQYVNVSNYKTFMDTLERVMNTYTGNGLYSSTEAFRSFLDSWKNTEGNSRAILKAFKDSLAAQSGKAAQYGGKRRFTGRKN